MYYKKYNGLFFQKHNFHYTQSAIRRSPSRAPITGPAVAVPAVASTRGSEKVVWIFMLITLKECNWIAMDFRGSNDS